MNRGREASFTAGRTRSGDEHISSLLVMYRQESLPTLEAFVAAHPSLDIAASGDSRCVVLCETHDQRALMDLIDALGLLPGIVNVSLIYHHAEPRAELDLPVDAGTPT